jgi:hypothetical protein
LNETAGIPPATTPADALLDVRRLRTQQRMVEALVLAGVAGALPAATTAHPGAPVALVVVAFGALAAAWVRAGSVRALRGRLGSCRVVLHRSATRVLVDPPNRHVRDWSFNLAAPARPIGPLLVPGLGLAALGLLQLVPVFAGRPASVEPAATGRALVFLAALLALHAAASASLMVRSARQRFRRAAAWLGGAVGLAAVAAPTVVSPAPFPTRELVAGYLVLVVPLAASRVRDAWRTYRDRLGRDPGLQREIFGLSRREGRRLIEATAAALCAAGALVATGSPGALLALTAGLGLAAAGHARRREAPWAAALLVAAAALVWLGLSPLESRATNAGGDTSPVRAAWSERVDGLRQRWATGEGLATASAPRAGGIPALPGWLQIAVEGGLPGVFLAAGAALAVLRRARYSPWLFASLSGSVLHGLVRLDVQVPATAALFVALAAMPERRRSAVAGNGAGGDADADETLPPAEHAGGRRALRPLPPPPSTPERCGTG